MMNLDFTRNKTIAIIGRVSNPGLSPLRSFQMRRNISNGRFELWRLFMTDADSLPVKKMSKSTSHRELRSSHRKSPFNDPSRRVKISRFWNEDYLASSCS